MKRLFLLSVMLTAVMAMQAQMKVTPKMQQGMVKEYASVTNVTIPSQKDVNVKSDSKYTVTEVTPTGYVVDMMITDCSSDATPDNIAGQLISSSVELLKGINIRVATNQDGKVERIVNYAELKPAIEQMADQLVDKMFQVVPQLSQAMKKEVLKEEMMRQLTEEQLLVSITDATSVLALNGKTVMTGVQEEFVNDQGMKMLRMYFVNGNKVTTNASMKMSKDELKTLIIAQIEKLMPEQAEMIKQNIDQLIDSGMMKMDMKETATYEMQDDGWVGVLTSDTTSDTMGQTSKSHTVVTAK